jgi:hypothetical protein
MIDWLARQLPAGRFELKNYDDGYHWLLRDLKPEKVHATILEWMSDRRSENAHRGVTTSN